MNADDILKYGHQFIVEVTNGLEESDWHTPDVCGWWSVKEIIAHLASFEQVLVEVLGSLFEDNVTPTLNRFMRDQEAFNDNEVARRQPSSRADVWAEYESVHEETRKLLDLIPVERRRQNRLLPWYGEEYDLEDLIVYSFYGHKREHGAQIAVYRDQLEKTSSGAIDR